MIAPPAVREAIETLMKHGWSVNGKGRFIFSVTPKTPVPLDRGDVGYDEGGE